MSTIASDARIGSVHLTVNDAARSRHFYEHALGLQAAPQHGDTLTLAAAGGTPLLELRGDASAPPVNHHLTGLFHFAVLVPRRADLAMALLRLVRAGWRLTGASDHLVSEALYLNDPDGNGIEIYRDRPRREWRRDETGQLQMATLPLDLQSLLDELRSENPDAPDRALDNLEGEDLPGMPADTRIGHVHLQVAELGDIESFYSGLLGFEVMVRGYPGALFVAAGGYHHHIGLNTWNSRGAGAPPSGSVGLRSFDVKLPDAGALGEVLERVKAGGLPVESLNGGWLVRDPSGNGVLLTS